MGRYAPNLSDEQREAVTRAVLEDGMSAGEAIELAAAGALYGLEPFDVSESTARDLRTGTERTQSNGSAISEDDHARELGEAMVAEAEERAYLERQIARIKAIEEPSAKDLHALRTAMHALEDINRRAARRAPRSAKRTPSCRYIEREGELCSCAEPCFAARVVAEYEEHRRALAEGRPCTCEHPVPRSWEGTDGVMPGRDEHGNPVCHGCRLPIRAESAAQH